MFSQKIVNWIAVGLMSACLLLSSEASAQTPASAPKQQAGGQQTILFEAAYYDEYAPNERLEEDVRMMKATGITVVRIAESAWGTLEPKSGVFDCSHVDRVLPALDQAGIKSSWEH
jgi:beta-galactosidase